MTGHDKFCGVAPVHPRLVELGRYPLEFFKEREFFWKQMESSISKVLRFDYHFFSVRQKYSTRYIGQIV
jgi:hypothetical protein